MATPLRLKSLHPERVAAIMAADPRLILPVGTCDRHASHLTIGCDTVLVDRLADDLSAEFAILRAPTVEYGATNEAARGLAEPGAVRKKTLHLLLNDLLASWEGAGVQEFILLTANGDDAHQEALSTVMTVSARVRVVDATPARSVAAPEPAAAWRRGGEAETSIMLFLAPHLVDLHWRRIIPRRSAGGDRVAGAGLAATSLRPTPETAWAIRRPPRAKSSIATFGSGSRSVSSERRPTSASPAECIGCDRT